MIDNTPAAVKGLGKKQLMDISLFAGGLFVMYKYGPELNTMVENLMPNEA